MKIKDKKFRERGSSQGGSSCGGQGGCERRSKVFVKNQKQIAVTGASLIQYTRKYFQMLLAAIICCV